MRGIARTLTGVALSLSAPAAAGLTLAPVFTDHVVIQRNRPLTLEGTGDPGARVTAVLGSGRGSATVDADGHWRIAMPAMPPAGPLRLAVRDDRGGSVSIADVMVGDVWLCSGQSNMEFPVRRALDADSQIANADNAGIRLLHIPQSTSTEPVGSFGRPVAWQVAGPSTVPEFSAACYNMVRELQAVRGVAIGAIDASWGGTAIRAWLDPSGATAIYGRGEADLLALFGRDPLAANAAFFPVWADWYRRAAGGDQPWVDAGRLAWKPVPSVEFWDKWGDPAFRGFTGTVWMRRAVTLTAAQAAQTNRLSLGIVDDADETFVNGTAVGNTFSWTDARSYAVPARLWREGVNQILVAVTNSYGTGGFQGPAELQRLTLGDGTVIPLGVGWTYAVGTRQGGAPRPPWDQIAGLGLIYNRMIAPLGPIQLDGVAWYQGESDAGQLRYDDRLRALVTGWRRQFARPDLPVLIVGLPGYDAPAAKPGESGWAALRDEQRRAADAIPGAVLVPAIDIGERLNLHPANKLEVGHRLARAAEGKPLPRVLEARRQAGGIVVRFEGVTGALASWSSDRVIGFELCGNAAGSCRFASAVAAGTTVRIADDGRPAQRVRYAWADAPVVNLFDGDDMPISSFEIPIR